MLRLRMSWIGIVALAVMGCVKPPPVRTPTLEERNEESLRALRENREFFEAHARGDDSEPIRARIHGAGVLAMVKRGNCTEFTWPFRGLDAVPVIVYAPKGIEDLPYGFLEGSGYLYPLQVDEHWFVGFTP